VSRTELNNCSKCGQAPNQTNWTILGDGNYLATIRCIPCGNKVRLKIKHSLEKTFEGFVHERDWPIIKKMWNERNPNEEDKIEGYRWGECRNFPPNISSNR
jgi:DNA-directed RNA polymerase subunit RPC12/RpoP